ncbi:acyl transferase-like protein [Angomonas deanei]|nr:acyl transferase-like protein [Angomonas deanei]|eukprot:EPY25776.1 acyl transferase-like protein [Angomonas deanei]
MSVRRAVVFSGQGAQRKGMGMDLINLSTAPLWENMKNTMKQNYGVNIQEIVQDNPTKVQMFEDASSLKYINSFPCSATLNENGLDKTKTTVSHKDGVLTLTYFTQPCTLAAQLLALEHYKSQKGELENVAAFAGHSLGEFTALTALEVFSPETAANLTFRRGMLMETTLDLFDRTKHRLYACNPLRAKLHSDPATCDDMFFVLVELIARALAHTTSFLEVANYNVVFEQYVAAGDPVALAVLGKCLDPQFRANSSCSSLGELVKEAISSVGVDNADGITQFPNDIKIKDFVTSSFRKYGHRATFRRLSSRPG